MGGFLNEGDLPVDESQRNSACVLLAWGGTVERESFLPPRFLTTIFQFGCADILVVVFVVAGSAEAAPVAAPLASSDRFTALEAGIDCVFLCVENYELDLFCSTPPCKV